MTSSWPSRPDLPARILALALLVFLPGCGDDDDGVHPGVGTVSVSVVDNTLHQPVEGVAITIAGSGITVETDANGMATVEVPSGHYFVDAHVCCAGPGTIDYHVPISVEAGKTVDVELFACLTCVCASPDTPVATPRGDVPIGDLAVGDLVYSVHEGRRVVVPIRETNRIPVRGHRVVRLELSTGNVLEISTRHPTADGRLIGDLRAGDWLGGIEVRSAEVVPYARGYTSDILPDSDTGVYFAGGVPIGSTLFGGHRVAVRDRRCCSDSPATGKPRFKGMLQEP